ncbi:hypothetical protein HFE03_07750 [Paenibacillus sp. EKM102P]|uniref:hypothetical protein n=1 Tax=unclassified Paenibacillus TaxID=185978 RepID=UPI00142E49A3|nr:MULTISPECIES: hypothetical protein [unclassified Paenibacillus]KAF6620537.1 hypothetical protein HFE00_05655 [Paenibacillus sp. EKM101P]KAF6623529.1 hypothetical protein HFE03_07750 [Paenibacillus sp. EKM102P]KAF6633907.1 hypothetical protein HFE01_06755 [Paenibacillus sp. EKM10P]KAF6649435.1 hypothetical protein HFE02_01720 [Paenibacillus sp. EKM11P]
MDKIIASEQLLDKIINIDPPLKAAMSDKSTKTIVINKLSEGFEGIVAHYPHLIDDIQRRIVEYHKNKGRDGKITDFVSLVDWYSMSLLEKPAEWWDSTGEYFNLRMNEVINMFLMARFNFGLV